jgi:LemA protein
LAGRRDRRSVRVDLEDPVFGIIVVLILVGLALWGMLTFNRLVALRNRADSAWAQIDVQLKRRHDLIPNLVETVKGYAAHERTTLEEVVRARNVAVSAQSAQGRAEAENALSGTLKTLFAVTEQYPDLKANQSFLRLQEELTSTEDRIAYSRQFLNDSVQALNTKIETFPAVFLAGPAKATRRDYFHAEEADRGNVEVRF